MDNYLVGNWSAEQFVFRKGMSIYIYIEHAMHSLNQAAHNSVNNSEYSLGLFMDFQKAFNSLEKDILVDKINVIWMNRGITFVIMFGFCI